MMCVLPQCTHSFFFLMIRRPPRSTLDRSSAASDVYKRQEQGRLGLGARAVDFVGEHERREQRAGAEDELAVPVSYTHLRAHETVLDLVCRLLLEKKKLFMNCSAVSVLDF